jgi:hydrogenase-4 component F
MANAAQLDPTLLKISFILIMVGYGTKVGLAPMHTWLPDAHSQAPTPVSALLSGVLLNCAMYGILGTISSSPSAYPDSPPHCYCCLVWFPWP